MLLISLWVLVSTVQGSSGAAQETLCTPNTCFTVHTLRLSYLMTVRDREEENVLRSLLSNIPRRHQERTQTFWIGLKLHKGDCVLAYQPLGGFKWISGEEDSSYSNWEKQPASTCTEERCVRVLRPFSGEPHLRWTAGSCRRPSSYVCKFYFSGMCKALVLSGPGQIAYTAPFSERPQHYKMQLLPFGTYADISCSDQQSHLSVCKRQKTGSGSPNCAIHNGGCQHFCQQAAGELRCLCQDGYSLEEDGLSCRRVDACTEHLCEHQCLPGGAGHSCTCADGFKLDANLRNCSDIDECTWAACGQHLCMNSHGSYTCVCRDGHPMVDGGCVPVDECERLQCDHGCSDTGGSLSCSCLPGFSPAQDGRSCVDLDECSDDLCPFQCVNTEGSFSFQCSCREGFVLKDTVKCVNATQGVTGPPPPPPGPHPPKHAAGLSVLSFIPTYILIQLLRIIKAKIEA
uniref:Thrombomodulin n=1 Tax=Takifugu rubripes TaxID=31033 RepID=A0A674MW44_TAKRU